MPYLDILCLANSRKHGGRCVAGLRTDGQGWVRPVAPSEDGALLPRHYVLTDGTEAKPLDILRIDLAEHRPEPHQPENWVVGRKHWSLVARPKNREVFPVLRSCIEPGPGLLGGESDRIPFMAFLERPAGASLALVAPARVGWRVTPGFRGNRQIRAVFDLGGAPYDLVVTDPAWEQRFIKLPDGDHTLKSDRSGQEERYLLTISMGEPFNDYCYKLVAGVTLIPPECRAYF